MKTHTRIGADILAGSNAPMLQMAREIALNHHERWDGKGYPRGLAGKAIPESRSDRGHRRRLRRLDARSRLSAGDAGNRGLDHHATGDRNAVRPPVDDVSSFCICPKSAASPTNTRTTAGRGESGFTVGDIPAGHRLRPSAAQLGRPAAPEQPSAAAARRTNGPYDRRRVRGSPNAPKDATIGGLSRRVQRIRL